MKIKKRSMIISVFLMTIVTLISADDYRQGSFGNLDLRIQPGRGGDLWLQADQGYELRKKNSNRNRSITFYANSTVMVFVGTDDYEYMSKSTGSRVFHMLPFRGKQKPDYSEEEDGVVRAKLPNSYAAVFSTETSELVELEGFKPVITAIEHFDFMVKKQGGIELIPEKGHILIDYGWRTGEMPISQMWRPVTVVDGYGNKAALKMSDLWKPDPADRDEVLFKFQTNAALDEFLKKKCPEIRK